ncbi:MAG TPA: 5,6-dimethylbenzimidazole synthase [Aliidongia sp.]|nr:5,6-dimethylbenzimidazole synthase [Aliidongia sp.]
MNTPPTFDDAFRAQLRALATWRRDVREFSTAPLPAGCFERLVEVARLAPSVGLSEPWRFVLVEDPARRAAIRDDFARCNEAALQEQSGAKAALYARLKLAGLDQAPVQFAVFSDRATTQGHFLGRRTMPEMAEYSTVVAVHTLWLAARAEGIGLGWVSILNPAAVAAGLDVPAEWRLIGYFCLGYPAHEDDTPLLQRRAWEQRRDTADFILRR